MIVAATLPLLLEHGDRVTSRQIAEAAGIAEGTIFRVFADKDEIIAAVIEAALDPAPLEAALAGIPPDLAVRGRARRGGRDHAAARHRHLAARVERRHALPRDDAAPDGRQRRARAPVRRAPRRDHASSRSSRRGCCARSRSRRRTRCSPANRGRPTSSCSCSCTASAEGARRADPARCARTSARTGSTLLLIVVLQTVQTAAALALPTINARIIDNGVLPGNTHYIYTWGAVMLVLRARPGRVRGRAPCTTAARSR